MKMQRRAFTLVEVLIVVVIMAVLAAVVIPQFSSSADDAKKATSEFNLSTLRSVIQIYKAQHNGRFPTFDAATQSLPTLVSKTRVDGTMDPTGTCGPYLVEFPQNPFTGIGKVKVITGDPATSTDVTSGNTGGWLYNVSTGSIWLDSNPGYSY
jgi:general secretion pathway protein G